MTNTVWWQDFPRRANPDVLSLFDHCRRETHCGLRSDFSAELAGFSASLLTDVPSQAHWILEFTKYNFEHSAGHLVASVPGIHSYKPSYLTESAWSNIVSSLIFRLLCMDSLISINLELIFYLFPFFLRITSLMCPVYYKFWLLHPFRD